MRPKSLTAQHWELFYTRAMICRLHLICPTLVLFVSLQRCGLNADCKAAHTSATSASCCLKAGNHWVMWPFGCCLGSFVLPVTWAWISVRLNQLRPIFWFLDRSYWANSAWRPSLRPTKPSKHIQTVINYNNISELLPHFCTHATCCHERFFGPKGMHPDPFWGIRLDSAGSFISDLDPQSRVRSVILPPCMSLDLIGSQCWSIRRIDLCSTVSLYLYATILPPESLQERNASNKNRYKVTIYNAICVHISIDINDINEHHMICEENRSSSKYLSWSGKDIPITRP